MADRYVIILLAFPGIRGPLYDDTVRPGMYLLDYRPEAFEGRGSALWTEDRRLAKKFPSTGHAMEYYQQRSIRRPHREDGRPNRPLTAATVIVEKYRE